VLCNYLQFFLYPPTIICLATALFLVGCDGNIPVDGKVDELVGHVYAEAILVPLRDHYVEFVGERVRVPVHHCGEYNTLLIQCRLIVNEMQPSDI
jgi:hypothetical protein